MASSEENTTQQDASSEHVDSVGKAHKRQKLGFESYYNSETFSDVTIRYGNEGKRKFYGHRLLLSSKSYWFKVAFTGRFLESGEKEITLKGDDPAIIEALFHHVYHSDVRFPKDEKGHLDNVLFCLDLYSVADKYDFPDTQKTAALAFSVRVYDYLTNLADTEELQNNADAFKSIVAKTYAVDAGTASGKGPHWYLLNRITGLSDTALFGERGILSPLVVEAATSHADFARDMFLDIMERCKTSDARPLAQLIIVDDVRCPDCGDVWKKVRDVEDRDGGHCRFCGGFVDDWYGFLIDENGTWAEDS
ncbi:hypothetical protein BDV96DRAFT_647422 [Lophiotrema nucula]|uniref:BTB domain-containing protein n=1 Tax=Lophiotrema nucula TaxID=690887 RepID=A0A6A5Z4A3_9PLEO|nr:hypothetical protein BDV96DRAFT_647422 [Lophiotrema nucula]